MNIYDIKTIINKTLKISINMKNIISDYLNFTYTLKFIRPFYNTRKIYKIKIPVNLSSEQFRTFVLNKCEYPEKVHKYEFFAFGLKDGCYYYETWGELRNFSREYKYLTYGIYPTFSDCKDWIKLNLMLLSPKYFENNTLLNLYKERGNLFHLLL